MSGEVTGAVVSGTAALEQLYGCLTGWRLTSGNGPSLLCWGAKIVLIAGLVHTQDIAVASAALIFYDWALTCGDELGFLWRRERITYTRVLFALARYPALACAVVDLLPPTVKLDKVATCLRLVTIICSELILATRTWAIWERSRPMLVFLAVLAIACAATAIVIIERDIVTTVVAPSAVPTIQGVRECQVLTSAVKHAWIVPYLVVMVFEAVVLALTVYKILGYYKEIPKQSRSKLFDVLWVDGVMYFVFMLLLGILNVGLVLQVQVPQLRAGGTQLQTVLHSTLSTRIVLHLVAVSKQDLVDSRSTLARYQRVSTRMRFGTRSGVERRSRGVSTSEHVTFTR